MLSSMRDKKGRIVWSTITSRSWVEVVVVVVVMVSYWLRFVCRRWGYRELITFQSSELSSCLRRDRNLKLLTFLSFSTDYIFKTNTESLLGKINHSAGLEKILIQLAEVRDGNKAGMGPVTFQRKHLMSSISALRALKARLHWPLT